jgi:hypothetical protein
MQKKAAMEAKFGLQGAPCGRIARTEDRGNRHFSSNYRPPVSAKFSAFSNAAVTAAGLRLPTGEVGV